MIRTYPFEKRVGMPKLPADYEKIVRMVYGTDWKNNFQLDMNGILGIAICKSILDGVGMDLKKIARHLNVDVSLLYPPYEKLSKNGFMKLGRLQSDEELGKGELMAWCYMAGFASGDTGIGT